MSALTRAASVDDLRALARRRMPRFAFDFVDGGAEAEFNLADNCRAFEEIRLCPRYLVDVSEISFETVLFGKTYSAPFGIAPMGFLNMAWPGADMMMAQLAARKKMVNVVSTASSTTLEALAEASDGHAWFQLYVSRDEALLDHMLARIAAAGYEVLVVTIDVAQSGKRDRDIRNGLQIPFNLTPRIVADLACHPRWSLGTLRNGPPGFANFTGKRAIAGGSLPLVETQKRVVSNNFTWDELDRLRERWKGPLLLKGLLHRDDADLAVAHGCDGIIVSNHGGRQVDYGPAAIAALPDTVAAAAGKIPVLIDSGVRRGADVVRAKALGADFAFAGRAFAFGAAAGGEAGCARAFDILESELTSTLGQIGQPRFDGVGHDHIVKNPKALR